MTDIYGRRTRLEILPSGLLMYGPHSQGLGSSVLEAREPSTSLQEKPGVLESQNFEAGLTLSKLQLREDKPLSQGHTEQRAWLGQELN